MRTTLVSRDYKALPLYLLILKNLVRLLMCHQNTKNQVRTRNCQKSTRKTGLGFSSLPIRTAASAVLIVHKCGFWSTLVYHIFHDGMHLKPYNFNLRHKLKDKSCEKKAEFCPLVAYLTFLVNNQNNHQWYKSQPYFGTELHDQKILVWCAIPAYRVFGSYYFENTVNQYNNLQMLNKISGLRF